MPSVGFRPDALVGGGEIINEMSRDLKYQTDFDTLPGRKYFTCKNFEVIFGFFRVLCTYFDTFRCPGKGSNVKEAC
ncbi:hypothetical protein YC2023_033309 [Brassica napus]